jgi:hypothetical protein
MLKVAYLRFMLYGARIALAMAELGGNHALARKHLTEARKWEELIVDEQVRQWLEENAL